jgi:hypothetical protein
MLLIRNVGEHSLERYFYFFLNTDNTGLNITSRNTKNCAFQQEPVLSILKKERIKNALFKHYKQKY